MSIQGIPPSGNDAPPQAISEQPASQASTTVAAAADPKLDLYARKERELAKKRREFDEARQAWEAEKKQYLPKSLFKEDPVRALSEVSMDYDKLTETILSQPNINDPTIRTLQARITEMEQSEARRAQQAQDAEKARLEQARSQRLNEIKLATNGNEDFDLIEKWSAHEAVTAYMDEMLESGQQMSVKDACKAVEEQLLNEAVKILESSKIKSKLNPAQAVAKPGQTPAAEPDGKPKWKNPNGYTVTSSHRNQFNTLTNRLTQEAPKQATTELDRVARAIAVARGELK